jgi:cytochrome oxidase Cu insertion factor (SCO1/SenC/PrrC family)
MTRRRPVYYRFVGRRWVTHGAAIGAVLLLRVVSGAAAAQSMPAQSPPDVQKLGPQVGEPIPDFTLPDQRGQARSLDSLMGPNGLMLVFFRSADW